MPAPSPPDSGPPNTAVPVTLSASLIVLTMGDRPQALQSALQSAFAQSLVWCEVIVVWNGCEPGDLPQEVISLALPENVGVPEGRNVGAALATGDVLVFLDDDATYEGVDVVPSALAVFAARASVGVVAMRIIDHDGRTAQRHVPRLRGAGVDTPGTVTGFLGGAVAIRRDAFRDASGYSGGFFYAMEESDLALAIVDQGWSIRYEPDLRVRHPRTEPSRHADYLRHTMRNRVLLARRRLPVPVGIAYIANWVVVSAVRCRLRPHDVRAIWCGLKDGIRAEHLERSPIRWRTVMRLSRLGRPPII